MQKNKFEIIKEHLKDKRVLDIGCVDHSLELKNKRDVWMHDFLIKNSKEVVGIDILPEEIELLNKKGYNIILLNCENLKDYEFKEKFDVIFAGGLIEHLSNQGLFLEGVNKHLKEDGEFLITTMNGFSTKTIFQVLRLGGADPEVNPEHTCWYSPSTIKELLRRYNFKVTMLQSIHSEIGNNWKKKMRGIIEKIRGSDTLEWMIVISKKINKEVKF